MSFKEFKIENTIPNNTFHSFRNFIKNPKSVNRYGVFIKNIRFEERILFSNKYSNCYFENCHFEKGLEFEIPAGSSTGKVSKIFEFDIYLKDCRIDNLINMSECTFEKKVRIHDCEIHEASSELLEKYPDEMFGCNFNNTKFNDLADFWKTTFNLKTIFYKTDFNATAVFSFATFCENVLFTYSLFGGKTIFAKTDFKKGLDISQAVIQGKLQLFDLRFEFKNYDTKYLGKNHSDYQDYIDNKAIIPLENKVHTFQILKKDFIDTGNYSDSILMQREEKNALRELIKEKAKEESDAGVNLGDKFILWLNRWSNHYQSDFRNGIWFTLVIVIFFGIPTLISTGAYLDNVCLSNCRFSAERFNNGVKFFFNFLNPARSISYLDELKPFGTAYLFDFLGRIAVGYGFYQTIQAFRKFK